MKKYLFLLLSFILTACGYHLGTLGHPQIKSIAVAVAVNETVEPYLAAHMRQFCAEQIQTDGTYKLETIENADAILYTRVVEVSSYSEGSTSTNNESRFRPRAFDVSTMVEYTLIIPGHVKPIENGRVTAKTIYQPFIDVELGRQAALKQGCRDASVEIIKRLSQGI